MAEELRITITAKDGASQVFKAVADAAKKVSTELEAAGRDGDQGLDKIERGAKDAAQQVDKIGDSAKRASVSFRDFDFAITAIGAGLTYAGNAALEQQQTIIGLQSAYGDAAEEMIAFADEMANVTIFNDDDILRGERYFATLRNNYDLTISEVQQLMQTTADLASAYGTSFEDASSRITAAIRGEGEAAEFLGLTMNQQAIDRQNLTLTMSNQEAAQFRLNALYQQTGVYQGTAAALVESEVGTRAKLTNALKDNAQGMAAFVGPLITQAAGIGMASTGIASMAGALGKLGPAVRNSTLAMSALGLAFNPVTLGIGAVLGVGALLVGSFRAQNEAAQEYNASLATLETTIENLKLAGEGTLATQAEQIKNNIDALGWLLEDASVDSSAFFTLWEDANGVSLADASQEQLAKVYADFEAFKAYYEDAGINIVAVNNKITDALNNPNVDQAAFLQWVTGLQDAARETETVIDDVQVLATILSTPLSEIPGIMIDAADSTTAFADGVERLRGLASPAATGMDEMASSVARIESALEDGSLTADELAEHITMLDIALAEGHIDAVMYEEAMRRIDDALLGAVHAFDEAGRSITDVVTAAAGLPGTLQDINQEAASGALDIFNAGLQEMIGNFANAGQGATGMFGGVTESARGGLADLIAQTREWVDAMLEVSGMGDPLSQWTLREAASDAASLANNLSDAASAADSVFRVIVGNTDAIASQASATLSWAEELVNVRGELGLIDELVSDGLITGTSGIFGDGSQYAEAQEAYDSIAESVATIEQNMAAVQAIQAPLIADATANTAAWTEELRTMSAEQQLITLGWMDSATAAKAMEINMLAAAAASGEMGANGEQAFTSMVEGAVRADPVLKALLIDMNLIEEGADGEIRVNFDSATQAQTEIGALNQTLADLIDLLDDGTLNQSYAIKVDADVSEADATVRDWATQGYTGGYMPEIPVSADTSQAQADVAAIPESVGTVTVPVELSFLGGMAADSVTGAAQSAIDALRGTESATLAITADTSAADQAIADMQAYEGEVLATAMINVAGDSTDALGTITAMSGYEGVTIATPIVAVAGEPSAALGTVQAMSGYEGVTLATAIVGVAGDASDALGTIQAMSGYDGMVVATAYVNIVGRQIGSITPQRHGGIPGYAMGGTIFEAGEAGPELAYFAGGGVALLGAHGLYSAPEGTYISPNNALNGVNVGGVTVAFNGNFYGSNRDELNQWAARDLIPTITTAIQRAERGQGVR